MRRYETIFVARPDLSPDDLKTLFDKMTGIITQSNGQIVKFDEWGVRRLAYEVQKQSRGFYCFADYVGSQTLVKELERNLKIDDRVIKYLTVKTEDAFSPESLQAVPDEGEKEQVSISAESAQAAGAEKPE